MTLTNQPFSSQPFSSARRFALLALPLGLGLGFIASIPLPAADAKPGARPQARPGPNPTVKTSPPEDPQASAAQRAFKQDVEKFVASYCVECHGDRPKAGLNLRVAVRKPGDPAFARKWMEAIANVQAHDMPPDDADQPSDDERKRFLDAVAQVKYLSARDPGPFVIRRLTPHPLRLLEAQGPFGASLSGPCACSSVLRQMKTARSPRHGHMNGDRIPLVPPGGVASRGAGSAQQDGRKLHLCAHRAFAV